MLVNTADFVIMDVHKPSLCGADANMHFYNLKKINMYNEVTHNMWSTAPPPGAKWKLLHCANSEYTSTFKKVNSSLINQP